MLPSCLFLFKLIYLSALSLTGLSSRPQLIAAFLYYAPSARHAAVRPLENVFTCTYVNIIRALSTPLEQKRRLFEKIIPTIQSSFRDRPGFFSSPTSHPPLPSSPPPFVFSIIRFTQPIVSHGLGERGSIEGGPFFHAGNNLRRENEV